MQIRTGLKRLGLFALIGCMVLSFFGCKKDESGPTHLFETQVENWGYYFQQGVPDTWKFKENKDDMLDESTGLCFQSYPEEAEGNVVYSIYSYYHGVVRASVETFANWTMNSEHTIYFNKYFLDADGEPRENYSASEEAQVQIYNRIQSRSVQYTFVKDGEDWKGVYNVLGSGTNDLIVITYEAKADVYDTYFDTYKECMNDFRLLSRQTR